jgi:dTDP-4-dehydrorhamnose reductase
MTTLQTSFAHRPPLEIWGGVECTVNRVGDQFFSQLERSGHDQRLEDLNRFAELGLRAFRMPVLWERVAPNGLNDADWRWTDARLERLRDLNLRPIVGLLHHGSGPLETNLLDPRFPQKLASYARGVAERYPWVSDWTPVNEPLTTARFSALYGHWYPHARDERAFLRATLHQCRAVTLAMQAIREVNPNARLVQTEDLGRTWSTPRLSYQADFENERRWLSLDLISGRLEPHLPMWSHLRWLGVSENELRWFLEHPCPPDIVGINHYLTSERFLDERLERYPTSTHGGNGRDRYADVEAVRVLEPGPQGPRSILRDAWARYGLPLSITECHLGCSRDEQLRWLMAVWRAAVAVRDEGADIRAVTVWSLLGAFDWDSLLTRQRGRYEPGVFDARHAADTEPRPTALTRAVRELARGEPPTHPVSSGRGWWVRPERLLYPSVDRTTGLDVTTPSATPDEHPRDRPLLILGSTPVLVQALERWCHLRGLEHHALPGDPLEVTHTEAFTATLRDDEPWAVICADGLEPTTDPEAWDGLTRACEQRDVRLMSLQKSSLPVSPLSALEEPDDDESARARARLEHRVLEVWPRTLFIRRGLSFHPWAMGDATVRALRTLASGGAVRLTDRGIVTPSYLPDVLDAALDLLIDDECGAWHLAHGETVTHADFVRRAARVAGLNLERIEVASFAKRRYRRTPAFQLRRDRHAALLPPLEDALKRFVNEARPLWMSWKGAP